jgi:stage III sporulation protein AD
MDIVNIVGIGLIATMLILILQEQKTIVTFLLSIFVGIVIFLFIIGKIAEVIAMLQRLADQTKVNAVYFQTILKIMGIAYVTEFGAQIVRDAGQDAIASKIELAGKVLIMVLAIPIITVVIETVVDLFPAT